MDKALQVAGIAATLVSSFNYLFGRGQRQQPQPEPPQPPQQPEQPPRRRDSYPDEEQASSLPNLDFYRNKIPSKPRGAKIEEILSTWYGDHDKLINHTGYMQWLFPNEECGMNPRAFPLKREEARAIRSDPILKERVRRAFKMLLDLYGMTLNDRNEFKLIDDDPQFLKHFISQRASHMWVTRILKALKALGHEELIDPWLKFLEELIFEAGVLPEKFRTSFTDYWKKV